MVGLPSLVHYWADLQSVYGLRGYDNIARTRNVSECLYSLYDWFKLLELYYIDALSRYHDKHSRNNVEINTISYDI